MAVPGEITSSLSRGSNALLRLGATPVTSADDVLEAYGLERAPAPAVSLGPVADALLALLAERSLSADELLRASGVDPGAGGSALVELELAGRVTHEDGVYRAAV
jgi:DNA processing protein